MNSPATEATRIPHQGDLVRDHGPAIYRLAFALSGNEADAADLTQEVFLAALEGLSRSGAPDNLRAWLLGILHHKGVDARRARRRLPVRMGADVPAAAEASDAPERHAAVLREIRALPEELREPLLLYYVENLEVAEIGRLLGIPEGTVKSRLHHGRAHLKRTLSIQEE